MSEPRSRIPFVIFFLERSGSSHLCSLLDSHHQVCCGAEEFTTKHLAGVSAHESPRYIHSRNSRILAPDNQQTREHLHAIFSRSEFASGFKIKYPIQFNRYPEVMDSLRQMSESLRVIHLDRQNVLKKFVSKQLLVHYRSAESDFRRAQSDRFPPIRIETDQLLSTLERFATQRHELKEQVSRFRHVMYVEYEDFNSNSNELATQLLDFLQVDTTTRMTSRFRKKARGSIQESVLNYSEIRDVLVGTTFEPLLTQ